MHLALKALSAIVMIAGFFVLGIQEGEFTTAIGDWLMGRRLDRLAAGGAVIGVGSLIWYISTRLEPAAKD